MRSPRSAHFIHGPLLEVPTSCLLVPLASPTFLTLRRRASLALCGLLACEAALAPGRVVNVMFHTADFLDDWCYGRLPFALTDLVPHRDGGCTWRRFLQTRDPQQIRVCTDAVIESLTRHGTSSLREIYDRAATRR